jgi:hypothetical protein
MKPRPAAGSAPIARANAAYVAAASSAGVILYAPGWMLSASLSGAPKLELPSCSALTKAAGSGKRVGSQL